MLVVLFDTDELQVFDSAEQAHSYYHAQDAETEIRAAFDDKAHPYTFEWMGEVRRRRGFLGLGEIVDYPEWRLVPSGPPDVGALLSLLGRYRAEDPSDQPKLDALRQSLSD